MALVPSLEEIGLLTLHTSGQFFRPQDPWMWRVLGDMGDLGSIGEGSPGWEGQREGRAAVNLLLF